MKNKVIILLIILTFFYLYVYYSIHYNPYTLSPIVTKNIIFDIDHPLHAYNSSISKEDENYIVYSRIDTWPFKYPRKNIYMGITILDKDLNTISQKIDEPKPGLVVEDLRPFFWNGQKYFIGTFSKYPKEPIFYPVILDEKYNICNILDKKMKTYNDNKNFIPIEIEGELYMIKNHNPLEILKVEKILGNDFITDLYYLSNEKTDIPKLRGSTLYEPLGGGRFLGITHTVNYLYKKYQHYFTILNASDPKHIYIEKVSKPLCLLGGCGIEFAMGFVESFDGKSYVITLGKKDHTSHLVVVNKEDVNEYF